MNITITARKCNLRQSFKDLAERKISKLNKFFSDDAHVNLTVTVEKNYQRVEITVYDMDMVFRSEHDADDMCEALDMTVDAIVRQIRKNKTRLERRLRNTAFDEIDMYTEKEYDVIRRKSVMLKPMSIDEAIMEMELIGHAFFMFLNAETGQVGVVYRRRDGGYGVLEAEN